MLSIIIAILVVIIDQISKIVIRANLGIGENIGVIRGFFSITHFENKGAAFSSLVGQNLILLGVPVLVLVIGTVYLIKNRNNISKFLAIIIGLILGGDIGNFIDRLKFHSVTDMFSFKIFPAIFNVADIAIVMGCFLLVIYVILDGKRREEVDKLREVNRNRSGLLLYKTESRRITDERDCKNR